MQDMKHFIHKFISVLEYHKLINFSHLSIFLLTGSLTKIMLKILFNLT